MKSQGASRGNQEASMFFWLRVRVKAGRCSGLGSCNSLDLKRCLSPPLFIFLLSGKVSELLRVDHDLSWHSAYFLEAFCIVIIVHFPCVLI